VIKLLLRQVLALFIGGMSPLLAADSAATVTEAVNQVTHGSSQTAESAPATAGTRLEDGEYLKTGVKSRAELELANLSITRLGANTIFNYSATANEIDLQSGTVLFSKPKDGAPMTIKTASVTAAVVGTSGFAQLHGKAVLFGLIEGHATLTIGTDPIDLTAGQIMRMGDDGKPQIFYFNIPLFLATSPLIIKFHKPLTNQAYIDKEVAKYKEFASRGFIGPPSEAFLLSDFDGSVPITPAQGRDSAGKALDMYNYDHMQLQQPFVSNGFGGP